uniref:(northern house mosquito) hypothetical protein n=2 Tax=Culex pipiens TaxID=7175 RepID=A0A8D8ILJ1_CULPI
MRDAGRIPHVRQYLRKRFGHHSTVILRNGTVPHANVACPGVYSVPSDPKSAAATAGGVLPARVDLHERHRHELGAQGLSRVPAGGHLSAPEPEPAHQLFRLRSGQPRLP